MHPVRVFTAIFFLLSNTGSGINAHPGNQTQQAPTELALEIGYYKNAPPAYQSVPRADSKPQGAWYARFSRIKDWQLPSGELPVKAVNIISRLDGEIVAIKVSVLRGIKFHDQETTVGTYELHENDSISIEALEQFGVKAFSVRVARITPLAPSPLVRSLAKSLEIVAIQPLISTLPTYKLTLRNLSDKPISALKIEVFNDGRTAMTSMPHDKDGLPLINAGALYESNQPLVTRAQQTAGGYTPTTPTLQETVISAVIFTDGSYEGDPGSAARFRAFILGRKLALTRLLAIFATSDDSLSPAMESAAQLNWFRDRILAVPIDVDENALAQLQREFPTLDEKKKADLRISTEVALHGVRKDLLSDLAAFGKRQPSGPGDFRLWLVQVEDRYRNWLSRL